MEINTNSADWKVKSKFLKITHFSNQGNKQYPVPDFRNIDLREGEK